MSKKLYVRSFPTYADEKTLFRQFGKKKIEKIDIIEKKDSEGQIISKFCYVYAKSEIQAQAILTKWHGRDWDGNILEVKVARESFVERAAKLKTGPVAEKKDDEFKPIFQSKTFEESSDENSSSDDDEEIPEKNSSNLQNAAARLHDQVQSRADADRRRRHAVHDKQERYQQQRSAKFHGKKVLFSDSDASSAEDEKQLFSSGDESVEEADFSKKMRREFEDEKGSKLFEMEKGFGGDERFKMSEDFKDDIKLDTQNSGAVKKKRKPSEFVHNLRFIPPTQEEIERSSKVARAAEFKEKNKYTNIRAPEVSKEIRFEVEELNIGVNSKPQESSEQFSLLSLFGRPADSEDVNNHERTEEYTMSHENTGDVDLEDEDRGEVVSKVQNPKPNSKKTAMFESSVFNLFQTYDHSDFFMTHEDINEQREALRKQAVSDYSSMAKSGKNKRDRAIIRSKSKIERVLNWW